MPIWTSIVLPLLGLLLGSGGVLAWVKYTRSEAPAADAGVVDTLASAKLKDAQATETIAKAFTDTLASVRQLAEDRAKENADLRVDLGEAEKKIDGLEQDVSMLKSALEDLRHYLSPRGEHGEWDERTLELARETDPEHPAWPPPPTF